VVKSRISRWKALLRLSTNHTELDPSGLLLKQELLNAAKPGKVMSLAVTLPMVTSTIIVRENERKVKTAHESKLAVTLSATPSNKELLDRIGSRRSSQNERDQRSRTRLREVAQGAPPADKKSPHRLRFAQ